MVLASSHTHGPCLRSFDVDGQGQTTSKRARSTSTLFTMASIQSAIRPFGCLRTVCREFKNQQSPRRFLTTAYSVRKERVPFPENLPEQFKSQIKPALQPGRGMHFCYIIAIQFVPIELTNAAPTQRKPRSPFIHPRHDQSAKSLSRPSRKTSWPFLTRPVNARLCSATRINRGSKSATSSGSHLRTASHSQAYASTFGHAESTRPFNSGIS